MREIRSDVVIVPIGFLSDHMEVLYDLDVEARRVAEAAVRACEARPAAGRVAVDTLGSVPSFCAMPQLWARAGGGNIPRWTSRARRKNEGPRPVELPGAKA